MRALIALLVVVVSGRAQNLVIEDYYWREYAGFVPNDALAGGEDYNGNPIFMGQALYRNGIIPAKIYPFDNKAYYGWGGKEYSSIHDIKILCTQHPEKFVWIKTKYNEINLLTNHHIVIAGYPGHEGVTLHFGRVHHGMETSVGKVGVRLNADYGLHITQNGTEYNYQVFEILTYNRTIAKEPSCSSCVSST